MQTTSELLDSSIRHFPDKDFIREGDRTMTYARFGQEVARLANVLADHGVTRGTPVGLYLPSCAELAVGYHACQRLGAIAAPMSAMFRRREVADIATRTDMPVMVTDTDGEAVAHAVMDEAPQLGTLLVHGEATLGTPLSPLLRAASPERPAVACDPEDIAVLFFTSGTTGKAKGAMENHSCIYFTVRDMDVYNRFKFGAEVVLGVLPIFNNFGATCLMMATVYNGGTLVLHRRWDTERVLEDIGAHGVTFMAGTPTMFVYMWKAFDPARHDLSSLRLAVTGGAPVAPEVIEACERELGVDLVQIYGATETTGYITGEPVLGIRKRGSAGLPFGTADITIMDDDGNVCPPGEVGEIVVGGDVVGAGYWRDEGATAAAFTPQGWRSGDLGYVDEDGYLFIVDRKKDLIISGGYNIIPVEVEDVLYRHPDVVMCAVVGKPDPVKGEVPVAFVVPKGHPRPGLDEELRAYCRDEIAAYKAPREVRFVPELPLGPSGKILKRELRTLLSD